MNIITCIWVSPWQLCEISHMSAIEYLMYMKPCYISFKLATPSANGYIYPHLSNFQTIVIILSNRIAIKVAVQRK